MPITIIYIIVGVSLISISFMLECCQRVPLAEIIFGSGVALLVIGMCTLFPF
jgi:hypothetical protein